MESYNMLNAPGIGGRFCTSARALGESPASSTPPEANLKK
ncbi:hydrogenase 2 protein HybA [Yersinia bercovieri ATCC 43970]|uniref:Hydrogenase 2 protein HybA n=1 Tax=Yersinia bercovieri ATCC 43970 TaxID=349968 RepID=A0ABP2E664_YERBE|nr:hydrogenase 2 protein HybA [Yersinia bercovieri ATCC 43970]